MKTILIPLTSGFTARNVLQTDIFKTLKDSEARLVFVVSPGTKNDFSEIEVPDKIIFEEYERPPVLQRKFGHFCYLNSFNQPTTWKLNTETIKLRRKQLRREKPFRYYFFRLASWIVSFDRLRNLLRKIDWAIFPKHSVINLFKKYRPDLLFSTDPLFFDEVYYLEYAKKSGIKSISLIMSWDNLTARGVLPVLSDYLIVWNEIIKQEAINIYNFNSANIFIGGIPQFDLYFHDDKIPSRENFFNSIGADPSKKLIVYTTGSPTLLPGERQIIDIFCSDYLNGKIKGSTQLLIRLNPRDSIEKYSNLMKKPGIFFDLPGRPNRSFRDFWNPSFEDVRHLAATLKYADVLLNMCSTISIEAAIFDTPVINVNLDKKLSIFYLYTHFSRIINTGGTRLAGTREELIDIVNMYLNDPGLDRNGRKKIVAEQCYYTDGFAGKRIANYIINHL